LVISNPPDSSVTPRLTSSNQTTAFGSLFTVIDFAVTTGALVFVAALVEATAGAALPVFGVGLRFFCAFACGVAAMSAMRISKVETDESWEGKRGKMWPRRFVSSFVVSSMCAPFSFLRDGGFLTWTNLKLSPQRHSGHRGGTEENIQLSVPALCALCLCGES
jgi:hypothetical protein